MKKSTLLFLIVFFGTCLLSAQVTSLSGTGAANDPWKINNIDDLKFLRDQINQSTDGTNLSDYQAAGKYFELTENIDLTGEDWVPIGILTQDYASFRGHFNGAGFKISNLTIGSLSSRYTSDLVGLFGELRTGTVIRNLNIENAGIYTSGTNNGILAARGFGDVLIENVKILNSTIDIQVTDKGINTGGIVGVLRNAVVINSTTTNVNITTESKSNSTAKEQCVGGIAGRALSATAAPGTIIINCASNGGSVVSKATDNEKSYFAVAGILGRSAPNSNANPNSVINCYTNTGMQLDYVTTTITGAKNVGGIVGTADNNFQVTNSIANNTSITQPDGGLLSRGRIAGSLVNGASASDNYASAINFTPVNDYSANIGATTKDGADLETINPVNILDVYVTNNSTYTFPSLVYGDITVTLNSWADVTTGLDENVSKPNFEISYLEEGLYRIYSNEHNYPIKANIYTINASLVHSFLINKQETFLNLNLRKGIYIISVNSGNRILSHKFIVK